MYFRSTIFAATSLVVFADLVRTHRATEPGSSVNDSAPGYATSESTFDGEETSSHDVSQLSTTIDHSGFNSYTMSESTVEVSQTLSPSTSKNLHAMSQSTFETSHAMSQSTNETSHVMLQSTNETIQTISPSSVDYFSTPIVDASKKDSISLAISEADVKLFSYVTRTILNPIICLVGFVSNSLGVGVLKTQARQQKLSIFWYLFALTIADIMFLGQGIIDSIPRIGHVFGTFDTDLSKYLMAHFRTGLAFFDLTFLHSARYIVVVMSFERLISVMNPLHVKSTWFAKYPMRIVIGCVIFNALIALPMLIFATVLTRQKGDSTEYIFTFKHYDEFMSHWWIVEATFHSFVPMLFLVPINIAIPIKLYRASKFVSALNRNISTQQKKVTITVMTITILYIFLTIPFLVMKILQYVDPDFNMQGRYRLYFWFIADLGRCLGYLNAANDFLVYFLVSNNYRSVFKTMYCRPCGGKPETERLYRQKSARHALSSSNDTCTVSSSISNVSKGL